MRVKKPINRSFRYSTQGTVEAAARLAKLRANTAAVDVAIDEPLSCKEHEESRLNSSSQSGIDEDLRLISEDYQSEVRSDSLSGVSSAGVPCKEEAVGAGGSRDWASMTVHTLKEELRIRGLKVSGRKAELVERLLRE